MKADKEKMISVNELKTKYAGALAWSLGDNPAMADELADLIMKGFKTASCSSLTSYQSEIPPLTVGSYGIILNGAQKPVCVIRITSMYLIKFNEVTEKFANKEGEGDLTLDYWRREHKAFFTREGWFSEKMELVAEEFELIEVL